MLALVKKDVHLFAPGVYIFLGLFIFVMVMLSLPATFAMIISVFAIALSPFTYDEKNKTNTFVASMPVTRKTIVTSRYVYSLFILMAVLIIEWIGNLLNVSTDFEAYDLRDFVMFLSIGIVLLSICYPILYAFHKSYMAMLVIFVLIVTGSFFTIDASVKIMGMTDDITFNRIDKAFALMAEHYIPFFPYPVVLLLSVALLMISIRISIVLFQRKDLT